MSKYSQEDRRRVANLLRQLADQVDAGIHEGRYLDRGELTVEYQHYKPWTRLEEAWTDTPSEPTGRVDTITLHWKS